MPHTQTSRENVKPRQHRLLRMSSCSETRTLLMCQTWNMYERCIKWCHWKAWRIFGTSIPTGKHHYGKARIEILAVEEMVFWITTMGFEKWEEGSNRADKIARRAKHDFFAVGLRMQQADEWTWAVSVQLWLWGWRSPRTTSYWEREYVARRPKEVKTYTQFLVWYDTCGSTLHSE